MMKGYQLNTASGGKADIICFDEKTQSLLKMTLMCVRQDQVNNEIVPIRRHLVEEKKNFPNTFSFFVAPIVHEDARQMSEWCKHKEDVNILPYPWLTET